MRKHTREILEANRMNAKRMEKYSSLYQKDRNGGVTRLPESPKPKKEKLPNSPYNGPVRNWRVKYTYVNEAEPTKEHSGEMLVQGVVLIDAYNKAKKPLILDRLAKGWAWWIITSIEAVSLTNLEDKDMEVIE